MFASIPELVSNEMIRVTKKGGENWICNLATRTRYWIIFRTNAIHLPKNPNAPPSPLLWGIPEAVEKRLIEVSEMYFEHGTTMLSIISPGHFWQLMSSKYGPLIKSIRVLKNQGHFDSTELLRKDFLKMIDPFVDENTIRLLPIDHIKEIDIFQKISLTISFLTQFFL